MTDVILAQAAISRTWYGFSEYGLSKHGETPDGGDKAGSVGAGIGPVCSDMADDRCWPRKWIRYELGRPRRRGIGPRMIREKQSKTPVRFADGEHVVNL